MISSVSVIGALGGFGGGAKAPEARVTPTVDSQIRLAAQTLERSKRDLAAARLQAERHEQQTADARRLIEQMHWLSAGAETNPEAARFAVDILAAQTAAIESAQKARADTAAQIIRLQSRIERQTTRFFDLQARFGERDWTQSVDRNAPPVERRDAETTSAEAKAPERAQGAPFPLARGRRDEEFVEAKRDMPAFSSRRWSKPLLNPR